MCECVNKQKCRNFTTNARYFADHFVAAGALINLIMFLWFLQSGDFSVSMKAPDKIKHFRIEYKQDGKFKIGVRIFNSLEELIEHYKRAPIFTNERGEKMYLIKPFDSGS